ncbi:hypothetical protein VNO80_05149 [Phaseolus coccineus]|uniref:Uncharacterized protein n=1 Tax=Phaseolus coccineus TaxID=3886 RepID=A0AAN9NJK9_PHACN
MSRKGNILVLQWDPGGAGLTSNVPHVAATTVALHGGASLATTIPTEHGYLTSMTLAESRSNDVGVSKEKGKIENENGS